jgi:hypothetical protein
MENLTTPILDLVLQRTHWPILAPGRRFGKDDRQAKPLSKLPGNGGRSSATPGSRELAPPITSPISV